MKMTRIKYMTIFIAVLVGLMAVFSYVNFDYAKGLEVSDNEVIEYPGDNPDLNMPDGEQTQSTGNPADNPNMPTMVYVDTDGNAHEVYSLPDGTTDEYDSDNNVLIKRVKRFVFTSGNGFRFFSHSETVVNLVFNDTANPFDSVSTNLSGRCNIAEAKGYGVAGGFYLHGRLIDTQMSLYILKSKITDAGFTLDDIGAQAYITKLIADNGEPIYFWYPYSEVQYIPLRAEKPFVTYEQYIAEQLLLERQKYDNIVYNYEPYTLLRDQSFGQEAYGDNGPIWTGISLLEEANSPYGYGNPFVYPMIISGKVNAEYPQRWDGDFIVIYYHDGTKYNINMTNTGSFNYQTPSNKKIVDIRLYNNNRIGGVLYDLYIALFNPTYGEGYFAGELVGYDNGHNVGYVSGKYDGYTQGAQETLDTANIALSFFPTIFAAVGGFFIDVLGGITLFGVSLWSILITVAAVVLIAYLIKFIT